MSQPKLTSEKQIRNRVERFVQGENIYAKYVRGESFPTLRLPLSNVSASRLRSEMMAVRDWIASLEKLSSGGESFVLEWKSVGGVKLGRNQVLSHVRFDSYEQVFNFLGTRREAARFKAVVEQTADPELARWATENFPTVTAMGDDWEPFTQAALWIRDHRDGGYYLRQIGAQDVDTKFVERYRGAFASFFGVSANAATFDENLGFLRKPSTVRFRHQIPGLPGSDLTMRIDELEELSLKPRRVLIVENLVTFLSVPVPQNCLVLSGAGHRITSASIEALSFLQGADLLYWGDLDLTGLQILDRLRQRFPQTRSVMMDDQTLERHRLKWVPGKPSLHGPNTLTPEETRAHALLAGSSVGGTGTVTSPPLLEQERIPWPEALEVLRAEGWAD